MKILFFSSYFHPYISGITTYPLKILTHLAQKNDVTVLTFPHNKNVCANEKINNIKVVRMGYLFKLSKGYISPQSIKYFWENVKKTDAVLLNIPNFEGVFLAIIAKILNKKIISLYHCDVKLENNLQGKFISFFLNLSIFIQLLLSKSIIAYTQDYVNNSMAKRFRNKIKIILPPINKVTTDDKTYKKFKEKKENKIWLGFAGRIAREKGILNLISAFLEIRKTYKNIELVFAGPYGHDVAGEEKYYSKVKDLLIKNQIPHYFFGNLVSSELGVFYKTIDLLVLPSINQTEAFGMVQAEAMIAGTPVVTTNLPGVRVPVRLTKMGIIIEPDNPKQITEAVIKILKNKSDYSNKKLVEDALSNFDIKKTYKFYDGLFS